MEKIPRHEHNGIDSPRLQAKNLSGFPIFSSVPSHVAEEGTIVLYDDGGGTYGLYVYINSDWRTVTLT